MVKLMVCFQNSKLLNIFGNTPVPIDVPLKKIMKIAYFGVFYAELIIFSPANLKYFLSLET